MNEPIIGQLAEFVVSHMNKLCKTVSKACFERCEKRFSGYA